MELKRTNLNDKITDTINDFNDNWGTIEEEVGKKTDGLLVKNEIKNGDFSQGNIGFITSGSGTTISVVDGKLNVLAGGQHLGTQCPTTTILNNKYYLRAKIDGTTNIYMGIRHGSPLTKYKKTNGVEVVSLVTQSTAVGNNIEFRDNRASGYTLFTVDDLLMIDLTTTFGAGNEPTEIEMDALIEITGYIDDEYILSNLELVNWLLSLIRNNTLSITTLGGTI